MQHFFKHAVLLMLGLCLNAWAKPVCQQVSFKGYALEVCSSKGKVVTYWANKQRQPYSYFAELLKQHPKSLVLSNAGMFDNNYAPIGLYVERGKQYRALNLNEGGGNFHLMPNGVFYVHQGKAAVTTSQRYAQLGIKPQYATQSGPMLVIDGRIHPKFGPRGTSFKTRSGICVVNGKTLLVHSMEPLNFYTFAQYFVYAGCQNALYLDGAISHMWSKQLGSGMNYFALGPMLAFE